MHNRGYAAHLLRQAADLLSYCCLEEHIPEALRAAAEKIERGLDGEAIQILAEAAENSETIKCAPIAQWMQEAEQYLPKYGLAYIEWLPVPLDCVLG